MGLIVDVLAGLLDLVGALLFVGSAIGLVRLPDFYTRLHAPTKVASLGLTAFALAAIVRHGGPEHAGVLLRGILLIVMTYVTVPISAQMMMRAAIAQGVREDERTRGEPSLEPVE